VCNPPYVAPGRGRPPANAARARARSGERAAVVEAARILAGKRARVCFVYPAHELSTLTQALRRTGLEPKRMRAVHATKRSAARIVLVEAQPGKRGGLVVMAPLFERDGEGESEELARILHAAAV
jgi:tRNA1Val (adenine37-N6)-methyltransferase